MKSCAARWCGAVLFSVFLAGAGMGQSQGVDGKAGEAASYFDFGTVVSLGKRSVEVQSFDPQRQRYMPHSFALARETRADLVHVGDTVEVIYVPNGTEWTLRRLVVLSTIPTAGPPPSVRAETPAAASAHMAVPAQTATHLSRADAKKKVVPPVTKTRITDPPPATVPSVRTGQTVNLGNPTELKSATLTTVPLGVAAEATKRLAPPATMAITHAVPSEECNRSSADWPAQPLSIAVLDFRYPTEREESHDAGTTGGGSGTAVADLVFDRLGQLPEFAVQRGDRRRLDRTDIAGAARLGRQLGVDAVLAGTFFPVEEPVQYDEDPAKPRAYELHAGLVDTCTGQVLMRLASDTCGGATGSGLSCTHYSVLAKEAMNPAAHAGAFQKPIDMLLYPLEHNSTAPGMADAVGVVAAVSGTGVTVRLAAGGVSVRAGDQLAVHATRLAKNPSTYTLNALHDQEIGRLTVRSVQGAVATGAYAGDIVAKAGDTVVTVMDR